MHGYITSNVATDSVLLKQQVISNNTADEVFIVLG